MFPAVAPTMLSMPNQLAPLLIVQESELKALPSLAQADRTEQCVATRARIVLRWHSMPAAISVGTAPHRRLDRASILITWPP
jgi:hypothetical protein